MYTAKYLSPIIPSYNIEKTVSFFLEILDFKVGRNDKQYCIMYKDNFTVHISKANTEIGEMEFYLEVDNIEKLWNTIKEKLENYKIKEPFDQDYGMREIHVIIPETKTLLFIGQEITK